MKKNIRSERGITLTVLVITVVVLSILSFTIIINMKTRTNISKLSQLKSDISTLEEKVSNFYNKYGEIPADIEYTNTSSLEPIMNNKEKTSESKFYVIDLQAMKGISLNYGRDYENVKNKVSLITPVPGGVGPMTIAMLMNNCVETVRK